MRVTRTRPFTSCQKLLPSAAQRWPMTLASSVMPDPLAADAGADAAAATAAVRGISTPRTVLRRSGADTSGSSSTWRITSSRRMVSTVMSVTPALRVRSRSCAERSAHTLQARLVEARQAFIGLLQRQHQRVGAAGDGRLLQRHTQGGVHVGQHVFVARTRQRLDQVLPAACAASRFRPRALPAGPAWRRLHAPSARPGAPACAPRWPGCHCPAGA